MRLIEEVMVKISEPMVCHCDELSCDYCDKRFDEGALTMSKSRSSKTTEKSNKESEKKSSGDERRRSLIYSLPDIDLDRGDPRLGPPGSTPDLKDVK